MQVYRVILAHFVKKSAGLALKLDNDAIRDMYEKGMTQPQIAEKLGTNPVTISNRLNSMGVKRRPRGRQVSQVSQELKDVIYDMYVNENLGGDKIAEKLDITQHKVYSTLKSLGIEVRPSASQKPSLDLDENVIRDMYVKKRLTVESIARSLGASRKAISSRLRKMGIETSYKPPDSKLVYDLYVNQNMSSARIAKLLRATPETVRNILKNLGVKIRDRQGRLPDESSVGNNALIQKMLLDGKTVAEVVKSLTVSQGAVEGVLKELRDRLNQLHQQHERARP